MYNLSLLFSSLIILVKCLIEYYSVSILFTAYRCHSLFLFCLYIIYYIIFFFLIALSTIWINPNVAGVLDVASMPDTRSPSSSGAKKETRGSNGPPWGRKQPLIRRPNCFYKAPKSLKLPENDFELLYQKVQKLLGPIRKTA